jgi:hypothetical protein
MIKRILIATATILGISLPQLTSAQLHKGNIFIGNNFTKLEYNTNKNSNQFQLEIKPKVGYFFANNLALGLYSNFGISKIKNARYNTGGLGVFGRYYFNNIDVPAISNFRFFGELNLGFIDIREKYNNIKYNNAYLQSGINVGGAYFLSSNVSIETAIGYQISQTLDLDQANHKLNFEIGVQVYLPSARVKESYRQLKQEIKN